ncbi:MAG: SUMF1/EgtB/PvdO family nonheme iron enzyme [Bacteroidota bacterium]
MIKIIFICIFLSFIDAIGQKRNKQIPKPPDGIWLYENLFIDVTEVTNIHWLEFLHYISDSSDYFQSLCLLDSSIWEEFPRNNQHYSEFDNYLRYPAFRHYPVVGISYKQASLYCEWRSKIVSKYINANLNNKNHFSVKYRLPTKSEWEYAARCNLDLSEYPYGYKEIEGKPPEMISWKKYWYFGKYYWDYVNIQDSLISSNERKEEYMKYKKYAKSKLSHINYNRNKPEFIRDELKATVSVDSGLPNEFGILNMIGNVAEIIMEKGYAKGGSWMHPLEKCKIKNDLKFIKPEPWLGFRCIAEVTAVKAKSSLKR